MSGWEFLSSRHFFQIFTQLPFQDVLQCQLVCKSWSTPAQHILYASITLESPQKAFFFLEGQLSSSSAIAAKFVRTLDIRQTDKNDFMAPELFQLLAAYCSNVEYLTGDSDSPLFWENVESLVGSNHWRNIKCIPYSRKYSSSYQRCANHFRHSLTNLTITDNGKLEDEIFKQIAVDYPNLKALEIFDNNQLVKNIHHLHVVSHHLPDLKHLCLDRGVKFRSLSSEHFKRRVPANKKLESIAIRLKNLDYVAIDYLSKMYPCLEAIKLEIKEQLSPDKKIVPIKRLFKLCMSASSHYQLKFSIKEPQVPLDVYYKLLSPDEPKSLVIAYTSDRLNPSKYTEKYDRAVVELGKNDNSNHKMVSVYYSHYENDEKYLDRPRKMLRRIGGHLSTLIMKLDASHLTYAWPNTATNGYFLDDCVFRYCDELIRLELVCYSLSACNKNKIQSSTTIQELVLDECRVGPILLDMSWRLPNLKRITFVECNFESLRQDDGAYCFDFRYSTIETLSIFGKGSILPSQQIYFDLMLPNSRFIYLQRDANSPNLEYLSPDEFAKTYDRELFFIRLLCNSIKCFKICAGSFNVEKHFDVFP